MATHDLLEISDPIVSEFECDSDGTDYIPSSDSDDSGDEIVPSPKKKQKKESSQCRPESDDEDVPFSRLFSVDRASTVPVPVIPMMNH